MVCMHWLRSLVMRFWTVITVCWYTLQNIPYAIYPDYRVERLYGQRYEQNEVDSMINEIRSGNIQGPFPAKLFEMHNDTTYHACYYCPDRDHCHNHCFYSCYSN